VPLEELMTNSSNGFRTFLMVLALAIGIYAMASGIAELSSLERPAFPSDPTRISLPAGAIPGWLETSSPFRADLESNHAFIVGMQTFHAGQERSAADQLARNDEARARIKSVLSIAPYDAELWLVLALLQAQRDQREPALTEALKMAYFTAPNDARLMPLRLDTATSFNAVADPDVKQLARGDVWLMVNRQPALRNTVVAAYRRASSLGRSFLEEAVQSVDPAFLPALRG
jgi:hypothetical protein